MTAVSTAATRSVAHGPEASLLDRHAMQRNDTNPIPPWERIAVDARTAAQMLSCGRSTFFARVKAGIYPPAGPDGRWSVSALRALHRASPTTTASSPA